MQVSRSTDGEIVNESKKADDRLESLALLSEAAAKLDPRPGVMLTSAGVYLV